MLAAEVGKRERNGWFRLRAARKGCDGVDQLCADEGCGLIMCGPSVVGVDEAGGGIGIGDPFLELV